MELSTGASHAVGSSIVVAQDGWRKTVHGGRECFVKWIDGKRVRSSRPQVCMTQGECVARARATRAEERCRTMQHTTIVETMALANQCCEVSRLPKEVVLGRVVKPTNLHSTKLKLSRLAASIRERSAKRPLSSRQICNIANESSTMDVSAKAVVHRCSARTVRRAISCHAFAVQLIQAVLTEVILEELAKDPLDWASEFPQWDETRQKQIFSVEGTRLKQPVEVFVHKKVVAWGWKSRPPHFITLVLPPVPVSGTTAANLLGAIRNSYFGKIMWNFSRRVFQLADMKFRLGAKDKASGNDRLVAFEMNEADSRSVIMDYIDCLNHQNMLGHVGVVIAVYSSDFLYSINAAASFFNLSTHRLRLLMHVRDFVRQHLDVLPGYPELADVAFAQEVSNYLMSWAGVGTGSKTSDLRQTSKCLPRSSLIREYFRIVNGGFSTNRIVVKTHLPCTAELFETTVQTLTKLITDAMVAPIFPTPSTAKWTKTGPCNDRFIFCSCNSILPELTERGLSKLQFEEQSIVEDDAKVLDTTQIEWKRVANKQSKVTLRFLRDPDYKATVVAFAITDESSRYLTQQHLYHGYKPFDAEYLEVGAPSTLEIYIIDQRSPIYAALSNLASIMQGVSTRLVMLWRFRACNHLGDWFTNYPRDAMMVFRGAAAQSAAIQRRQRNQLHRLEIFTIGDPSVDLEEKMRIAGKFVRSSRTQVGDGLPGRYWDRHQSKVKTEVCNREDIMVRNILAESSTVSAVLKFARFTVAPCESEHAKHRQAGQAKDQPVSFSRLAATSVNRQLGETGLLQLQGMQGRSIGRRKASAIDAGVERCDIVGIKRGRSKETQHGVGVKAKGPTQLHRIDWISDKLSEDAHFNPVSATAWAECRGAWDSLCPEMKQIYFDQADAAGTLANIPNHLPLPIPGMTAVEANRVPALGSALVPFHGSPCPTIQCNLIYASASGLLSACSGPSSILAPAVRDISTNALKTIDALSLDPEYLRCFVLAGRQANAKSPLGSLTRLTPYLVRCGIRQAKGLRNSASMFDHHTQRLPTRVQVPERVLYPCRPLAMPHTSEINDTSVLLHAALMKVFCVLSKLGPKGKPKNIIAADMFLCIESHTDLLGFQNQYNFYHMADAIDDSGINRADQLFHKFALTGSDPSITTADALVGRVIQQQYESYKERYHDAGKTPFKCHLGPAQSVSADRLATELACRNGRVFVHRLKTTLVWAGGRLDTFRIDGVVDTREPLHTAVVVCGSADEGCAQLDLLDLALRRYGVASDLASAATRPRKPSKRQVYVDELIRWLEEILEEHGEEVSPDLADDVRLESELQVLAEQHDKETIDFDAKDDDVPLLIESMRPDTQISWTDLLVSLNLEDREFSSFRYVLARPCGGTVLCIIHPMSKYSLCNLKAVCVTHGRTCKCWLTPKFEARQEDVLKDLAVWAAGADSTTVSEHIDASITLRIKYGHKPRGGPAS